jgi:hypothetical protein
MRQRLTGQISEPILNGADDGVGCLHGGGACCRVTLLLHKRLKGRDHAVRC